MIKKIYTVGEIAKLVKTTTETLRHYDRIGLVKPYKIDELTNYRYYSDHEVVRLNTIQALRCMDLSLTKIKEILSLNDFNKIIVLLKQAAGIADDKITMINRAKDKIATARLFYEHKLINNNQNQGMFLQTIPQRVILIAPEIQTPSLTNLWNYHRHFFDLIDTKLKAQFVFEDTAGIYQKDQRIAMFAICIKYANINGLEVLPSGKYLCANCTEQTKTKVLDNLIKEAKAKYNITPKFIIQLIVLSGILQWNYQLQIFIKS